MSHQNLEETIQASLSGVLFDELLRINAENVFVVLDSERMIHRFPQKTDEKVPTTLIKLPDGTLDEVKSQAYMPQVAHKDIEGNIIQSAWDVEENQRRRDEEKRLIARTEEGRRPPEASFNIRPEKSERMSEEYFRQQARTALTQDKLSIITQSEFYSGVRLDSYLFETIGLLTANGKELGSKLNETRSADMQAFEANDLAVSYAPPRSKPREGFSMKQTLTASIATMLAKRRIGEYMHSTLRGITATKSDEFKNFMDLQRRSQHPVLSDSNKVLMPPRIFVQHGSTMGDRRLTGALRIGGYRGTHRRPNRIGEFGMFSFVFADSSVRSRLRLNGTIPEDAVWAYHTPHKGGRRVPIVALYEHYPRATTPGKRSERSAFRLLRPGKRGLNPASIADHVQEKMGLRYRAPTPWD